MRKLPQKYFSLLVAQSGRFSTNNTRCREDKKGTTSSAVASSPETGPGFLDSAWCSDVADFPRVRATTILAHLVRSGKSVATDSSESDGVILSRIYAERRSSLLGRARFGGG